MIRRAFLLLGVCVAVAGCRESSAPADPKTFTADEQKAVDAAQAFLAKHNKDWGRPSKVERARGEYLPGLKGEGVYGVTYPTPEDEVKLIGDRAVLVDVQSGRVEFLPRR